MIEELPLLAFTICTQIAAGLHIARTICGGPLKGDGDGRKIGGVPASSLCVVVLMVVGMACSLFHLKHVDHVLFVFSNIGSSWLSNEIALSGAFFLLCAIVLALEKLKTAKRAVAACRWIGAAFALAMLFAQAMAYSHTGIAAWTGSYALAGFLLCAAATGSSALAFFLAGPEASRQLAQPIRWLTVVAGAAVVLAGAAFALHLAGLAATPEGAGAALLIESHPALIACRFILSIAGVALMGLGSHRLSTGRPFSSSLATGAFVSIVAGEVIGRILFYGGFVAL